MSAALALALPADSTLAEVDAALHFCSDGLQGLLDLLGDSPVDRPIRSAGLRALLLPMADQLLQAQAAAELLLAAQQPGAGQ